MSIQLIQQAICYIEEHIYEKISYIEIAKSVNMSSYDFHRMFRSVVGMTVNEYIRKRRLTLAAGELQTTDITVLDAAYKYGYETPESFSKAFSRFHGATPKQAKQKGTKLHLFNPLVIKITLEGGSVMDYKIEHRGSRKFLAYVKAFPNEKNRCAGNISDFWTECLEGNLIEPMKQLCVEEKRDLYGLCSSAKDNETHFNYGIGVAIDERSDSAKLEVFIQNGYSIWETEAVDYAVFKCYGSDSSCLDEMWCKFFKEFVPQTGYTKTEDTDYEIYFENGEENLFCELWIPVEKKG